MNQKVIEAEAVEIEKVIRERAKFKVTIFPAAEVGRFQYFVTPFSVVYKLHVQHAQRIADLVPLAEDFASFVNQLRRKYNLIAYDQSTTVRVDAMNHTVEVSRINRETLRPHEIGWEPKPMTALLGQSQNFNGVFPVAWNLASPLQPHALLAGASQRAGKTKQLIQILSSLALHNRPEDLRITIIDAKPSPDLRHVETLPHVDRVARDDGEALALAKAFYREMQRRYDTGDMNAPRRLLIVEELATLTESRDKKFSSDFSFLIEDISRRCGEAKMNLLVVTQKPTAAVLGSQLKSNLSLRIVGAVNSKDDSNTAVNVASAGADKLPGAGAMIWRLGERMYTYQSPLIEDGTAEFARIAAKWTGRPVEVQPQHRAQSQPQVMRHRDSVTGEVLEVVVRGGYEPDMSRLSGGYGVDMDAEKVDIKPDITGYNRIYPEKTPQNAGNLVSWPIGTFRPLEEHERAEVRRLSQNAAFRWSGTPSARRLCEHVYGSRSPERMDEIKRALDAQPIPLRPAQAERRHMRVVGGDD